MPVEPTKADGIHCTSNSDCAADHHCNEFHFCIPGAPRAKKGPVPNGACGPDGSCPAGQHCNEFKRCIDGARKKVPNGACGADGSCPAGFHCNEFKRCIAGANEPFLQ